MQVIRNAKLWCDVESAKQAKELSSKWDYNLVPGFTASKILWLKENEPENFDKLAKVLLPHDYINWYLTGEYAAEVRHCLGREQECFHCQCDLFEGIPLLHGLEGEYRAAHGLDYLHPLHIVGR